MGGPLRDEGRFAEASQRYEQLAAGRARLVGAGHPDAALGWFNAAFPGLVRHLGAQHPVTLSAACDLADCLAATSKVDQARSLHESVLNAHPQTLGPQHPDTGDSRVRLAELAER